MKFKLKVDQLIKKVNEYREETSKYAVWRGVVTESFKRWLKGEEIYDKDKARISLYVPEDTKLQWDQFKEKTNISTLSKLIRQAVDKYIAEYSGAYTSISKVSPDIITDLSHSLKEPLTTIKGFSQLLLKDNINELSDDVLSTIQNIFDQSVTLENKINALIEDINPELAQVDILLIEDDLPTVKLITTYLSNKGIKCKGVMSGIKGLDELKLYRPKMILLDIILPDMSGSEVCKKIKSNESYNDIPVYYLTAIPLSEVKKLVVETKANGYILKPFNLSEFDLIIDSV